MNYTCTQTQSEKTTTTEGRYVFDAIHGKLCDEMNTVLAGACWERLKDHERYNGWAQRLAITAPDSNNVSVSHSLDCNVLTLSTGATPEMAKRVMDYVSALFLLWEVEYAALLQGSSEVLADQCATFSRTVAIMQNEIRNNKVRCEQLAKPETYACYIDDFGAALAHLKMLSQHDILDAIQSAILDVNMRLGELEVSTKRSWFARLKEKICQH